MAEVAQRRVSFGDATLHQPEFLDVQQVLQAASNPSVEQFRRGLAQLEEANHGRFVRLREVSREQCAGCGESDLRRLKRQFASLKNTFLLYDVKQSFIEGLAEGFPDGSEEAQLPEAQEVVDKHSAEVKHYKERNAQMLAEVEELIDAICASHKEFSQRRAEIAAHLECLAAEAAQREAAQPEALPPLEDGPDETACKALQAHEAAQTRALEAALAAQEAEAQELVAAIQSEEDELRALHSQIRELELDKAGDTTQEVSLKFAEASEWIDELTQLTQLLGGVSLLSLDDGAVHLRLRTCALAASGAAARSWEHELRVRVAEQTCQAVAAELLPADVPIDDLVQAASSMHRSLAFLVREVQARIAATHTRAAELAEAGSEFQLVPADEEHFEVALAGGVAARLHVPAAWPEDGACPAFSELRTPSGVPVSAEALAQLQPAHGGGSLLALLRQASAQVAAAFGQA